MASSVGAAVGLLHLGVIWLQMASSSMHTCFRPPIHHIVALCSSNSKFSKIMLLRGDTMFSFVDNDSNQPSVWLHTIAKVAIFLHSIKNMEFFSKCCKKRQAVGVNTAFLFLDFLEFEFEFEFNTGSCKNECINAQVHMYIICSP